MSMLHANKKRYMYMCVVGGMRGPCMSLARPLLVGFSFATAL
jgi:hypothetical protein